VVLAEQSGLSESKRGQTNYTYSDSYKYISKTEKEKGDKIKTRSAFAFAHTTVFVS
jgi:hypothetical protein